MAQWALMMFVLLIIAAMLAFEYLLVDFLANWIKLMA